MHILRVIYSYLIASISLKIVNRTIPRFNGALQWKLLLLLSKLVVSQESERSSLSGSEFVGGEVPKFHSLSYIQFIMAGGPIDDKHDRIHREVTWFPTKLCQMTKPAKRQIIFQLNEVSKNCFEVRKRSRPKIESRCQLTLNFEEA